MKYMDGFSCIRKGDGACPYRAQMEELKDQGIQAAGRCADLLQTAGGAVLRSADVGIRKVQEDLGQVKDRVITEEMETQVRKAAGAAAITVGMTFLGVVALRLYLKSFDRQKDRQA